MSSIAAKQVAEEVLGTLGRGEMPNITKIAIKKGYTPKTANSGAVQATKTYQEAITPFVQAMIEERDAVIKRMKATRGKAKYRDLTDGIDKLTKNIQLLTGGKTENVGLIEEERKSVQTLIAQIRGWTRQSSLSRSIEAL